jgi:hypothetical protein
MKSIFARAFAPVADDLERQLRETVAQNYRRALEEIAFGAIDDVETLRRLARRALGEP